MIDQLTLALGVKPKERIPVAMAAIAIATGIFTVIALALDIQFLKEILPSFTKLRISGGLVLICGGVGLYLLRSAQSSQNHSRRMAAMVLSGLLISYGGMSLLEYLFSWNINLDTVFFGSRTRGMQPWISPNSALAFLFLGLGLALMDKILLRDHSWGELFSLLAAFIVLIGLIGCMYEVESLYGNREFTTDMSILGAVSFIALAIGSLLARSDKGFVSVLTSKELGSLIARRLMLVAFLLPLVLGWIRLATVKHGILSSALATSLVVVTIISVYFVVIWWNAKALNQIDLDRKRYQHKLSFHYHIARLLAESDSTEKVTLSIVQAVCEQLGWDLGILWTVDPAQKALRCDQIWKKPDFRMHGFEEVTQQRTFSSGVGLPGRVWLSRQPLWISDVSQDLNFPRKAYAEQEGLHGALAFPILVNQEVTGVVEFFSRDVREPRPALLEMMATVGSQIGQFVQRKQAEKTASQVREDFIAMMSHDLRNPLAAVEFSSQLIIRALTGDFKKYDIAENQAKIIIRSVDTMKKLVDDFLDCARVGSGRLAIESGEHEIQSIFQQVDELFSVLARERSIQLENQIDEGLSKVTCDRDRILQVFSNLIGNAIKFTNEGGKINLTARQLLGEIEFSVKDTGKGIAPELLSKVFDRYWQGDRGVKGTGLGLYIAKGIVEAHGGKIWAKSVVGSGTEFFFTLPARITRDRGYSQEKSPVTH